MAISFGDSKKKLTQEQDLPVAMTMSDEIETMAVSVYSASDDFTRSGKYKWYDQYEDSAYSTIDKLKNIKMDDNQINLTQEDNSQFIPFEMPRYYRWR